MGRGSRYFSKYRFLHGYCKFTDMNAKIRDIFFFFWSWRLKITFQYGGCKQSLGGIVPENSCEMQMPRYKRCRDKEGFEYR